MAGQPGPEGTAQAHHVSIIALASFGLRTGPNSQWTRPVAHSMSLDEASHRVPLSPRTPGTQCRSGGGPDQQLFLLHDNLSPLPQTTMFLPNPVLPPNPHPTLQGESHSTGLSN